MQCSNPFQKTTNANGKGVRRVAILAIATSAMLTWAGFFLYLANLDWSALVCSIATVPLTLLGLMAIHRWVDQGRHGNIDEVQKQIDDVKGRILRVEATLADAGLGKSNPPGVGAP
jgi:membrane protein implicated in regulation of membrane protease activity